MPEDLDALKARHAKEKKDLIVETTSLKHSINKNDKKRKKEVQTQIETLEKDLKLRHEKELAELTVKMACASTRDSEEVIDNAEECQKVDGPADGGTKKKSKAQKQREKKAEQEKRFTAAMKADAENALNSRGTKETEFIVQALAARSLKLVDVNPDGDCMYNALAQQLKLVEPKQTLSGESVREKTADYIGDHRDDFLPFLADGSMDEDGFLDYCEKVRNPCRNGGQWGGAVELQAISAALGRPVEVIHADGSPHIFGEHQKGRPLILTYHRYAYSLGEHYNATCPV